MSSHHVSLSVCVDDFTVRNRYTLSAITSCSLHNHALRHLMNTLLVSMRISRCLISVTRSRDHFLCVCVYELVLTQNAAERWRESSSRSGWYRAMTRNMDVFHSKPCTSHQGQNGGRKWLGTVWNIVANASCQVAIERWIFYLCYSWVSWNVVAKRLSLVGI